MAKNLIRYSTSVVIKELYLKTMNFIKCFDCKESQITINYRMLMTQF